MLAQSEELALTLEAKEAEILEAAAKQIEKGATRTQASVITEAMTEMTEAVGKSVGKAMGKAEVGGKVKLSKKFDGVIGQTCQRRCFRTASMLK